MLLKKKVEILLMNVVKFIEIKEALMKFAILFKKEIYIKMIMMIMKIVIERN